MLLSSEHMQLHTIQPQKQVHVANMKLGFTMKVKGTSEQLLVVKETLCHGCLQFILKCSVELTHVVQIARIHMLGLNSRTCHVC